jgi:hypothetical protein
MDDMMDDMAQDVRLLPGEVAVNEGGEILVFTDCYFGNSANEIPPIRRAVIVARLRRLADMIDGGA